MIIVDGGDTTNSNRILPVPTSLKEIQGRESIIMWPFIIAWIVLLSASAIFAQQTLGFDFALAPTLFLALPVSQRVISAIIAILALCLIGSAIWQSVRLARQNKKLAILNIRLHSTRHAVELADGSQRNLSSAVEHLVASDPENAIVTLQQRLTDTEQRTAAQQGRNAAVDMHARLDDIRRRQQALREQLGEVTETRRAIAPVFDELRERQIQLDRALVEVETDTNGSSLADRLKVLSEGVTHVDARLKGLEDSLATLNRFREELGQSRNRIDPLRARDAGIEARMDEVIARHQELDKVLDDIETQGGEKLGVRVDALARGKHETEQRMAQLFEVSALLDTIRRSFDELRERHGLLQRSLAEVETDSGGRSLVDRLNELTELTSQSRSRLLTLENSLLVLNRFKEDLDKYQTELVPLRSPVTGIEAMIGELHERRGRLVKSLEELEAVDGERLGARVEAIYRSKLETEQRIAEAMDYFARLDSIRKDVDGLFAKLNFTIERLG
jgi:predicted  nucleic acid-binding Zn-ribbon protein